MKIRLCIISFHCLNCAKKSWTVNRTYPQTSYYQSVFVLMLSRSYACFIFILLNRGLYLPFVFSYTCNNQCIVCLLLNIVILLTTMLCNCMNLVDHVLCHVTVLIWILFEKKRCFFSSRYGPHHQFTALLQFSLNLTLKKSNACDSRLAPSAWWEQHYHSSGWCAHHGYGVSSAHRYQLPPLQQVHQRLL